MLEHGSMSVNTSHGLKVRAGCVTLTPVHIALTHYEVSDVDGRVHASAIKDEVYIESRSNEAQRVKQPMRSDREIIREGEQKSREEKCSTILRETGAPVQAIGPLLNNPYVIGTGVGVVGVVACLALCHWEPISPDRPDRP